MTTSVRTVWFHRQFERLTGGHVKHADYFEHVARLAGHTRRIVFVGKPGNNRRAHEQARLWPTAAAERVDRWCPGDGDIVFLAGTDWRYFNDAGLNGIAIPRINLIQHVRHAHAGSELHGYLDQRAVRICVSEEVAQAIHATGRVNGPVLAIPNGTDCRAAEVDCRGTVGFDQRPEAVVIVGYKRRDLAAALSGRLHEARIPHVALDGFISRGAFLGLLERTRVAVCLPDSEEGFYLPALEAMAQGCTVVTLDCVGNRGFCRPGHNCLVAEDDAESLARATSRAVELPLPDRHRLHTNAADTVCAHSLEAERRRFHALLLDIDRIWTDACSATIASGRPAKRGCSATSSRTPARLIDFMILGAQKAGTSALAHFLAQHPAIVMTSREGHVFDSPEYSNAWTAEEIEERYRRLLETRHASAVCGESTPIYLFLPEIAAELRRYNPALKVLVILRDPVERALSHYAMERSRGKEHRPLWFALLAERWRLRRCADPRGPESAARRHSYRARGIYSVQLRNLYAAFPSDQVLVLRSEDLRSRHHETLENVFAFLGVSVSVRIPPETVFRGTGLGGKHTVARWLLRVSYAAESRRLRAVTRAHTESARSNGPLASRA